MKTQLIISNHIKKVLSNNIFKKSSKLRLTNAVDVGG